MFGPCAANVAPARAIKVYQLDLALGNFGGPWLKPVSLWANTVDIAALYKPMSKKRKEDMLDERTAFDDLPTAVYYDKQGQRRVKGTSVLKTTQCLT